MSKEQLSAILEKGDIKECMAFFHELAEKDRQSYAPQAMSWVKQVDKDFVVEVQPGHFQQNLLVPAAQVALLAACSLSQLTKLNLRALPTQDVAFEVLNARRPDWLSDWVEWLCEQFPRWWS